MGKILVIGATGNIGGALVTQLVEAGQAVKAGTRRPDSYEALTGVEVVHFDYDGSETWERALEDVDRVSTIVQSENPQPQETVGEFFDAAAAASVKHVVLVTAAGIENAGDADVRQVEKLLIGSGMDYTILRPNWFMQNFSTGFLQPMLKVQGVLMLPAGDGKTSFIDVRDIAAVAAAALTQPGHAGKEYTLTGSEALDYAEAVEILGRAAGREFRYVPVESAQFREALVANGLPEDAAGFMVELFDAVRNGYAAAISPAVEQVLGGASIRLDKFARDYAHMWI